jgi:hypothetical protein
VYGWVIRGQGSLEHAENQDAFDQALTEWEALTQLLPLLLCTHPHR